MELHDCIHPFDFQCCLLLIVCINILIKPDVFYDGLLVHQSICPVQMHLLNTPDGSNTVGYSNKQESLANAKVSARQLWYTGLPKM